MASTPPARRNVPALRVHQWLAEWDEVEFDEAQHRAKPPAYFHLLSMQASELRALSGIFRRGAEDGEARSQDLAIQRRHDATRSAEIRNFVAHGFPWSTVSKARQASGDFDDLKKPGWLPTAIVVNVLSADDKRRGKSVNPKDLIEFEDAGAGFDRLLMPSSFTERGWEPKGLSPIEVIDGQHRLWAFNEEDEDTSFELPVVAFSGLDISWQAYLFYTINIKPKKINTSLAYDLYPLLRTEDWLERSEGHSVYRDTRAQELTEALWSYPESPWHGRIDMLGDQGRRYVRQSAWIRSLTSTFIKRFEGPGSRIGGLFGAIPSEHGLALGWSRPQQSAFLIYLWSCLVEAVGSTDVEWATDLRDREAAALNASDQLPLDEDDAEAKDDPAVYSRWSLLSSDQGVRGVLAVFNDLCWVAAKDLKLDAWELDSVGEATSEAAIAEGLDSLARTDGGRFVKALAKDLATFDFRASGAPGLSENDRALKARFRGGTGYKELRKDLITHLGATGSAKVGERAVQVSEMLGY